MTNINNNNIAFHANMQIQTIIILLYFIMLSVAHCEVMFAIVSGDERPAGWYDLLEYELSPKTDRRPLTDRTVSR